MNSLRRFATREPTCCAICRRQAWSIAYRPSDRAPLIWACDHLTCIKLLKAAYSMKQKELDWVESMATLDASHVAGAYLEGLGAAGWEQLSQEQWIMLFKRYDAAREQAMRDRIMKYVESKEKAA